MRNLNKTFVGFIAGLISACILYFTLIRQHGIEFNDQFKYTLYRLIDMGLGLGYPIYTTIKNIFIKSSIITLVVILFNF
ncbi:hypothetical protein [Francisella persica]|uniref:hypothetical protein n=1 Tax=Francisella persica TaxID=954 RepID=UPI000A546948|nr:hypothetical protein [Francisella persica]